MREIIAEIVTIGDEILFGQITDTNSQWLGEQLSLIGIKLKRKISVGDELSELLQIFQESESRADIIILTGGLGPTSDDITKPALCQYFGCGLKMDTEVLEHVTDFFTRRNRPMLEVNKQQAAIPEFSKVLFNRLGTAPGLWLERDEKIFISLPGVPHEMKEIMISSGIPKLIEKFQPPVIVHKVIHTIGVGESFLAEMIKEWETNLPNHIKLAYLPSLGVLKLRLTAKGEDKAELVKELESQTELLQAYIAPHIFGYDDTNLEKAIGQLLFKKGLTLATAESCTGGSIAALLTSVSGSSSYFVGSVVAYSNEVKNNLLGVKAEILAEYGAVSEQTVREMAEGIRQKLGADIGVATSGIAGPTGGTPEKPVGTIWIAYSDKQRTITKKLQLTSERSLNVKITTVQVLNLIRENC
jgi:nicotinamide-nucleotide amidase